MSKQRQRVLLTGGAGFIGSHLAEALLRRGAQLTIVDNLDPFYDCAWKKANLEAVERVGTHEFHALDICDTAQLSQIMASHRPEVVIHLAACVGVRPSIRQPKLYERVNLAGTVNLLELCRQFHVSRFILVRPARSMAPRAVCLFLKTKWNCGHSLPMRPPSW